METLNSAFHIVLNTCIIYIHWSKKLREHLIITVLNQVSPRDINLSISILILIVIQFHLLVTIGEMERQKQDNPHGGGHRQQLSPYPSWSFVFCFSLVTTSSVRQYLQFN